MINLEKRYLELLQSILKKYVPEHTVWLFGSRATATIKPYSDIDLVIHSEQPPSITIIAQLSQAFAESDLPYKVDLAVWSELEADFKALIEKKYEIIQLGKQHDTKK